MVETADMGQFVCIVSVYKQSVCLHRSCEEATRKRN